MKRIIMMLAAALCSLFTSQVWAGVAKIGTAEYETLDAALSVVATAGGTVTVLRDCTMTAEDKNFSQTFTLDLAGHTVTVVNPGTLYKSAILGKGGSSAKITIKNGTIDSEGNLNYIVDGGSMLLSISDMTIDVQASSPIFYYNFPNFVGLYRAA